MNNRPINFRAQFDGKWYEFSLGDLVTGGTCTAEFTDGEFTNWCESTGLHDKNGVEIYEGDLLRGGMYIRNKWVDDVLMKVEYSSDGVMTKAGFRFLYGKNFADWQYEAMTKDMEVIGNILEHAELLNI